MKKSFFLILPLLAMPLFACGNQNTESSSSEGTSTSETSGGTSESSSSSSNDYPSYSSEDHTTTGVDMAHAVGIDSVKSFPAKVYIDEEINPNDVVLVVRLSDSTTTEKHPDYVEANFEGKVSGDSIEVLCHYKEFEISFTSVCAPAPKDILNGMVGESFNSTYKEWTWTTALGNKYQGISAGEASGAYLQFSNNITSAGLQTGLVCNYSVGAVTKVVVTFSDVKETKGNFSMFAKETPFHDSSDLKSLTKTDAVHHFTYDKETLTQTYTFNESAHYIGFKDTGSGAAYIEKIQVFVNQDSKPIELKSLEVSGTLEATTDDTKWDFSTLSVEGTFEGGVKDDVTKFCTFTSTTPIPEEPGEADVTVNVKNSLNSSVTTTAEVKANIAQGIPTACNWVYNEVKVGGTFSTSKFKNDATNNCYTENNSTVDTDAYVQVLNSTRYWTTAPTKLTITAKVGGGSVKAILDEGYEARVVLLNTSGEPIAGTEMVIADKVLEKTGTDFTVEMDGVANVAGVRLVHKKLSGYNIRFMALKLTYEL